MEQTKDGKLASTRYRHVVCGATALAHYSPTLANPYQDEEDKYLRDTPTTVGFPIPLTEITLSSTECNRPPRLDI